MTDKQTIFLTWLVIFAVAFMGMVAVQNHVNQEEQVDTVVLNGKWLAVNHPHSTNQGTYDVESKFIVEVPEPIPSTYTVLESHSFDEWLDYDKELLTQMMQVTAASALGIETELSFEELASTAPVHVLETYIDLLESAGY